MEPSATKSLEPQAPPNGASTTVQLWTAWCGYLFCAFFIIGAVVIARFLPPLDPANDAATTAAIYQGRTNLIRFGLMLVYIGLATFVFFSAGLADQIRRIPGVGRTCAYVQLVSVGCGTMAMSFPLIVWFAAAYRPERPSELTHALNDVGYIGMMLPVPFVTWALAAGIAILADTSSEPLFPRWSGYASILAGVLQIPGVVLIFFKSGPFAWSGIFVFWIPAFVFFIWIVLMSAVMPKAIRRGPDFEEAAPAQVAAARRRAESGV